MASKKASKFKRVSEAAGRNNTDRQARLGARREAKSDYLDSLPAPTGTSEEQERVMRIRACILDGGDVDGQEKWSPLEPNTDADGDTIGCDTCVDFDGDPVKLFQNGRVHLCPVCGATTTL